MSFTDDCGSSRPVQLLGHTESRVHEDWGARGGGGWGGEGDGGVGGAGGEVGSDAVRLEGMVT